jgi:hypothetical protein
MASALRVDVDPDFSSKSKTGSMMAQRLVSGHDTTYWTLKVSGS